MDMPNTESVLRAKRKQMPFPYFWIPYFCRRYWTGSEHIHGALGRRRSSRLLTTPMAVSMQLSARPFKVHFQLKPFSKPSSSRLATIRCSAIAPPKRYSITLLPGDGIGPEVISVAKNVLKLAGSLESLSCPFPQYHTSFPTFRKRFALR